MEHRLELNFIYGVNQLVHHMVQYITLQYIQVFMTYVVYYFEDGLKRTEFLCDKAMSIRKTNRRLEMHAPRAE